MIWTCLPLTFMALCNLTRSYGSISITGTGKRSCYFIICSLVAKEKCGKYKCALRVCYPQVRSAETELERNPQHAVHSLHESNSWKLQYQPQTAGIYRFPAKVIRKLLTVLTCLCDVLCWIFKSFFTFCAQSSVCSFQAGEGLITKCWIGCLITI